MIYVNLCPWQKKYGYPYVEAYDLLRRELQERIRKWLWNVRKQELLEKYSKKIE